MESMRDKVAIVGVGYTQQGRIPGRSSVSFHVEAARNAIEDAGLRIEDIDGILTQPSPPDPGVQPWGLAQQLGIRPRFIALQSEMGATAGCMTQHAAWAVVHGLANYVVCTYGENALSMPGSYARGRGDNDVFGMFGATSGYALAARRAMHEFGTGYETWAEIAVAQRKWANLNPRAMMHSRTMTFEDYHASRWVVEPFHLFDCCLVSDSGRAFIVTTTERARDCKKRPVYVMGVGQDHPATDIVQATHMTGPIGSKVSGEEAFTMAGITKDDIDACEIYDCYTYTVEVTLMGYGFFGPGEGKDFVKGGRLGPGGDFPVNTSGGLLSEVYQMGFTPLTEAVIQLRGEAGERQLGPAMGTKEPEIILVSGNGGILQTHSTTILRR